MAQIKRIISNKPKSGDISQYNFNQGDALDYENSNSLPENWDKFQNKDLFTNCVGDKINDGIIEKNLSFQGDTLLQIDNLFIKNTGVSGTTINNKVNIWIFSEKAYGGDPTKDGYTTVKENMKDEWKVFYEKFGDKSEGEDLGNITSVEGIPIISNFSINSISPQLGDFPGIKWTVDDVNDDDGPFKLDGNTESDLITSIFNQEQYNPIYIVINTKGDKEQWWPVNSDERRRKYSVYKINNQDLFRKQGSSFQGSTFQVNLTSPNSTKTGEGGSGAKKSPWSVSSLKLTINTSAGGQNSFTGVSNYQNIIPSILPTARVNENILNSFEWLEALNPHLQLDNDEIPDNNPNSSLRHPDFIPITTFGFSQNNSLSPLYADLQTYHRDSNSLAKSSTPLNVTFQINVAKPIPGELIGLDLYGGGDRLFYYFVISWDDKEDEIKSIQDWLDVRPDNEFKYLELLNQNLYKIQKVPGTTFNTDPNYLATLPFPQYREEFDISNVGDNITFDIVPSTIRYETRELHGQDISQWTAFGRPDITQYLQQLNIQETTYDEDFSIPYPINYSQDYEPDTELQIPSAQDAGVTPQSPANFFNPSSTYVESSMTETLNNVYTTPGIKNIKFIMFSAFDGDGTSASPDFEVGRWKLCTSRIYLDIPPNQYPDFNDVGGSDYTTLPWPYTTPIIGGLSENSKYKMSVQDTLSGGKISELDIIDEKLLINDLENDEMGKSIESMDLQQCRYFNTGYSMYDLLGINAVINDNLIQYSNPYYDGDINKFPMESSVGQIFISDNSDLNLKQSCKLELNTGELSGKSIIDSSGNSNKGMLIGDYKVKKNRKGEPMRRNSFIKVPKKSNTNGAL